MAKEDGLEGLIAQAKAGDREAFAALAGRFRPTMLLIAQGEGGNHDRAEDVVQDALLVALRALAHLDDPSRFGPWLATIVRHRARRVGRREGRYVAFPPEELSAPPSSSSSSGEDAIRALPEGIRESMHLYYLERWSVGEIAALLERPVTTVKWQLHAGRALLRKRLGVPENL